MGLRIRYRDPHDLKPRAKNPRTHTPKQIKQIAASIEEFGFVNPVLVDSDDGIVAGHARVEASKLLGMTDVPTVRVDHLTPVQIRAYVIADNRLAENAGWDRSLLAIELQELSIDLNFDVTVTGFETAEIDPIISELGQKTPDEADQVPPIDRTVPAVSRPGDLWRIGPHYLLCGDALEKNSYDRLLQDQKAQMVFVDPPYNVAIDGHVSGLGKVKHREFAMASGEMSPTEFTHFLRSAFGHLVQFSSDGSIHFVCMDWRHIREVSDAAAETYSEFKNLCVWTKTNAGMGSLYRSAHELVFVFKNGRAPHINNVELGRFGRNRTNVWQYAGTTTFGSERDAALAMHPTVKPLAMVADAVLDCSKRGGIILDAFAGSGTTLLAAERTGRRGYGIELDAHYADTIIRRFREQHSICAVDAATGVTFDRLASERTVSNDETKEDNRRGSQRRKR
jgi:DNA modification methylase